jgi:predicted DNA-binding protein
MPENNMVQFALRLPEPLLAELKQVAADADRTPSAEIRQLVRRHIESTKRLREAA